MPEPSPASSDQVNEQLLHQYNEIAQLAGALAHEIKNPLSVIGMNMELLAEDLGKAETAGTRRALNKVQIVQTQCHRLERLLDDFLRFARDQHGYAIMVYSVDSLSPDLPTAVLAVEEEAAEEEEE